jgi:hypothetical protein
MLQLLIDTSTWLDLAKRRDGQKWIVPIRVLHFRKRLELLVSQLVVDEYSRNRARIEAAMTASVAERFRLLRQDLNEYGGADRETSIELVRELGHQVPLIGAMTTRIFDEIAELLGRGKILVPGDEEHRRVVERGLAKKAPFHANKNSTADSMLIELYATAVHGADVEHDELRFITSNVRDFSAGDDHRKPHPDIAEFLTDDGSSSYFKGVEGIVLALQEHFGDEFDELVEESDFEEEPRTLAEIQEAEQEFFDRMWYERHLMFRHRYEHGDDDRTTEGTYQVAPEAAERVKGRRPDLRPTESDFEWGMWNGKLSALRWVLGSEWDFLDT